MCWAWRIRGCLGFSNGERNRAAKRLADIYEPHGIMMVMESMNHRVDHPNMFLHTIPQAYALAKAVGRPSVKVLFDFYHVQIQEGHRYTLTMPGTKSGTFRLATRRAEKNQLPARSTILTY
jgi:sugar phosphate isomerase/epimerase